MARRISAERSRDTERLRRELAGELVEKEKKIREFQKKMYDQLEQLATDIAELRKTVT